MAISKKAWFDALAEQKLEVTTAADAAQVVGWLDTGCYALNWAITGRFLQGYPLGHVVEIFGNPSTGKSFLVGRAMAMAQEQGGVVLLDDTEQAYNFDWMETIGINTKNVAYETSHTVEEHFDVAVGFCKAYAALQKKHKLGPGLLAIDSLAEISTKHEMESEFDTVDMTKAKELKRFFRRLNPHLQQPILYLATNHIIANIGNMWQKETTGGGGGPKYKSSVRIKLAATSKIKVGPDYVGTWCRAVVDKNRLAPPWKEVRIAIPFYQPISRASGLVPVLVQLGVLEKHGQFLRYKSERVGRAYDEKVANALKIDDMGEQLLDIAPEILEETDAMLDEQTPTMSEAILVEAEDE